MTQAKSARFLTLTADEFGQTWTINLDAISAVCFRRDGQAFVHLINSDDPILVGAEDADRLALKLRLMGTDVLS